MADVKVPSKLGSMSHTFQKAWYKKNNMELPAHLQRASSADKVDTTRTKTMQQKSLAAYGATKGTRMGSAEGTGETQHDTIKPLTRDQWSKVDAAKRAAKRTPLTKDQRMSAIAHAVRKAQSKHDVPTLDNHDDHADIRHDHDLMHSVGVRHSYNEGFDPSPKEIAKMLVDKHGKNVTKDHIHDLENERDSHSGLDHDEIMKHVKKMTEETKQEAEKLLGGPVKPKTGNVPAGKLPYGFRRARNLARQAMKAGKPVTESTTEVSEVNEMSHGKALAKMIMAKQSKHPIAQHMGEAKDPGEYDYEGDMAMSQLKSVIANAQKLHDMMEPDTNLPEWVQAKITLAEDYIVTAANYMDGQMDESAFAELDAELELFEKAPPGSKYERMVKHIKKGYSAGGLTPKEKSIAYATAWKAYNKANEEVEQIEEKYMGFKAVQKAVAAKGARNPAAVAAAIGRKKYGKEKFQAMAAAGKRHANEEVEQIDELKTSTLKSYANKAELQRNIGAGNMFDYHIGSLTDPLDKETHDSIVKHDRRDAGLNRAQKQLKARKLAKEETEGSVPTTPKEKELAAHHGDPNKITYGDVIKARLKAAAKKGK